HRSLREHLVAEHVADLPVSQATTVLLPHLWYDADWEALLPAAVALHPQRSDLLASLLKHAAQAPELPEDLSAIDGGWQVRRLLARVAAESDPSHWNADIANIIGQARVALARAGRTSDLASSPGWDSSSRTVRRMLLDQLAADRDGSMVSFLMSALARLRPT